MNNFRQKTDKESYDINLELEKFNGDITERFEGCRTGGFNFFSGITPYGLEKIRNAFLDRIHYQDRPVTLLWHHQGGHTINHGFAPVKQKNGDEPVNGQKGGYYVTRYDDTPCKMQDFYQWVSYGRKKVYIDGKQQVVKLEIGEPLSKIEPQYNWTSSDGHWLALPHYMPENREINRYPGDVKKAILASPLPNEWKQELLDELYLSKCPVKNVDSKYSKIVKRFCNNIREGEMSLEYIQNKKIVILQNMEDDNVPEFIKENLLLNINSYIDSYKSE